MKNKTYITVVVQDDEKGKELQIKINEWCRDADTKHRLESFSTVFTGQYNGESLPILKHIIVFSRKTKSL